MTSFGRDLVESASEALDIAEGKRAPAGIYPANDIDVAAVRKRLGLSQREFSSRYGLSLAVVRDWEQHRVRPDQAARTLLRVIDHNPDAVSNALASE
ncbi:MAG: helix-turn-helix domain-containing protein [Elsteraceae bacterium]